MKKLIFGGLSILLVSTAVSPALRAEVQSNPSTQFETLSTKAKTKTTIKSGTFVNGKSPTIGNAKIVEENGTRYVEFDNSFKTDSGPDLFVVLHRSADVIGSGQAPSFGIKEEEYVKLAPLQTTTGKQRYAIPANINLEDYNSVAIWCRRFNATFGAASLTTNPNSISTKPETFNARDMVSTILKSGMFVNGEHPTAGNAKIVKENGTRYVEFDDSFQTDSGPDLFVVLHRSADVIGSGQAPAFGIKEGEYVTLAPLQTTTGKQRYAIPANIDLEDYNSVAIWCRRFNATFGAASLDS